MMRCLPALLIILAAGCAQGRGGLAPGPDVRSPDRVVESLDGRWRLRIRRLSLAGPAMPGGPALLSLEARLDLEDGGHLLADRDPLVAVQRKAGVDHRRVTPHTFEIDSAGGDLRIRDLDVGRAAASLARLDLVCSVIVTRSYKPHVFRDLGPVCNDGLAVGPFVLTVTGERYNVWVAAARLDRPPGSVDADDLSLLLSHRWAAENATLHDAAGRQLHGWGGSGTEGGTVIGYGAPINETPFEISYPVTLELLVPQGYTVLPVRFRIENLRLPPADR